MTYQELFNMVLVLAGFMASWIFKSMWDAIKDLKSGNKAIADNSARVELLLATNYPTKVEVEKTLSVVLEKVTRLEAIEVMLASQYVTKAEFTRVCDQLLAKLDKIDEKLDGKADKQAIIHN